MCLKLLKFGVFTVGGAFLLGALVFGADLASYVHSSYKSVTSTLQDNIPIDFQLRRARDLLDQTGPEMRKNVRLMAEQEVDIANLKTQIVQCQQSLGDEKVRIQKLRDDLTTAQTSFTFGDFVYSRQQLTEELARRFTDYKQAEIGLDQKQQLLLAREKALALAEQAMDSARGQRATLEEQVDTLESRYRLEQAQGANSDVQIDRTKLSQANQVIAEVRRQLDISERMLAQDAKFTQPIQVDATDEKQVLADVDAHLNAHPPAQTPSQGVTEASGDAK